MILTERTQTEIADLVKDTLELDSDVIVTKATKFVRFDWRSLIKQFELVGNGLNPPYCVLRPGPTENADWGMHNHCLSFPIEIFFIESERNRVQTQINGASSGTTITVDSTDNMFVDQRLYFVTANDSRTVVSVDSATQVTVNSAITVVNDEAVISDLPSDVEVKMEKLRTIFKPGGTFTNFQIMEDPMTDVSDGNPVNEHMGPDNYSLLAGSCYIVVLVGETLT